MRNAVPGLGGPGNAAIDCSEGERLLELGRFSEAEEFFLCLLDQTRDRPHRRFVYAKALSALADARYQQKKPAQARETALAALIHLDAEKQNEELADTENLLASICLDLGEPVLAVPHLERALATQQRSRPIDTGAIIERHRRLAAVLGQIGETGRAIEELTSASNLAQRECGAEHQLTGNIESELGRLLKEASDWEGAIYHFERALAAHLTSPGEESEEVARDYQALAETYQASDNLEQAVAHYEKALRLRERQLGGGNSGDYAAVLMGLGGTHSLRGNYGTAVELMQQAVGRYEGARDERLAPALESLGVVYVVSGRTKEAISTLRKARRLWEADPSQYAAQLQSNSQLFETVASYLNPAAGSALMASLRSGHFEEPPAEMKPDVKMPSMQKPKRPEEIHSLPSAEVELENWTGLIGELSEEVAPAMAPPAEGKPEARMPVGQVSMPGMNQTGRVAGIGGVGGLESFVGGQWAAGVPGSIAPPYGYGIASRSDAPAFAPVLGPLSGDGRPIVVTGGGVEGGMFVPASAFPALWEDAVETGGAEGGVAAMLANATLAASPTLATSAKPGKRQSPLAGWEELAFDYLSVTTTR
ncbi:MAG: tetratricopeptide repeat protein [Acidobacteria bacterium]|nr:tetratricopeptide repeat protein [Acidobacteriota bacterium]